MSSFERHSRSYTWLVAQTARLNFELGLKGSPLLFHPHALRSRNDRRERDKSCPRYHICFVRSQDFCDTLAGAFFAKSRS